MKWRKLISHGKDILCNLLKYYKFNYNLFLLSISSLSLDSTLLNCLTIETPLEAVSLIEPFIEAQYRKLRFL